MRNHPEVCDCIGEFRRSFVGQIVFRTLIELEEEGLVE